MGKQMYFMPRDNSEEDAPKIPWIQSFNFNAEKNANFQLEM